MTNEEKYRDEFEKLFPNLTEKKAKELDEQTVKLIDHVHNRISYTDQKHRTAFESCIAILTFAIALGVFLNEYNKEWLFIALPLVYCLSIVGIVGITLFIFQDRFKRPFIEVSRTWRWFYHYCIDPRIPVGPGLRKSQRNDSKKEYLRGLYQYAKNTLNATPQQILKQDIEQLFVLLTDERLKNEFLKQSQGVLGYGVLASIGSFVLNMLLLHITLGYALPITLVVFGFIYTIILITKVRPTTKSRQDWSPITQP